MLVPLYILVLGFHPRHAVALSNATILGGAIANTVLNASITSTAPVDWDLILMMEPGTIGAAVVGSLLAKVLPAGLLSLLLSAVLVLMGHKTLRRGIGMWRTETRGMTQCAASGSAAPEVELRTVAALPAQQEGACAGGARAPGGRPGTGTVAQKVALLTLCFLGTCALAMLKGGSGPMASPVGVVCGSLAWWLLLVAEIPWVLAFALYFRDLLVAEYSDRIASGPKFSPGELEWDSRNTIRYPLVASAAGLVAGIFGVGGGIIKGPLMLEMGVSPAVASTSSAVMILYTSASATVSYVGLGLLQADYAAMLFVLGVACTVLGQFLARRLSGGSRQSPVVLSIGAVLLGSACAVAVSALAGIVASGSAYLLDVGGVCH
ncbi:unnamed protein product [Prorocentrum cordatum]|uniref:Membrane transporter protein n=1 Tax=Prorocentrum cordatum TaxID=2364126 RepID=A0ABN9WC01_9DINO|nr:unnamed protein product [Polarella glacialis]